VPDEPWGQYLDRGRMHVDSHDICSQVPAKLPGQGSRSGRSEAQFGSKNPSPAGRFRADFQEIWDFLGWGEKPVATASISATLSFIPFARIARFVTRCGGTLNG
jgi:hypothetical protein